MFLIQCAKCRWFVKTKGSKKDLEEIKLNEIKNSCSNCGKIRKFRCPKCSEVAKMFRISDV